MLPKKELNIYPKNSTNINYLLDFYFAKNEFPKENVVEYLLEKNLSLNQIEFIVRKLSESWESIFKDYLNNTTTMQNLIRYGVDGFTKTENEISSKPKNSVRLKIKEFLEFVKETEIDFNYLEKNN